MRPTWTNLAVKPAISIAHAIIGKLINYLQGAHMNLSDRLKQLGSMIELAAPHLAHAATEAEQVVSTLAPVVAASLPGTGAATVASELGAAAAMAQQVQGAIVGAVTSASAPVPQSPVVDTASSAPTVDEAAQTSVAASSVAAQAAATPSAHEVRLQLVESALAELLPAVGTILKAFGR
jgi:hypothetical protein